MVVFANVFDKQFYCTVQGFEADESDDEWEGHIAWYYGAQAQERDIELRRRTLDEGMDMNRMVVDSHELVDRVRGEAAEDRDRVNRPLAFQERDEGPPVSPVCSASLSATGSSSRSSGESASQPMSFADADTTMEANDERNQGHTSPVNNQGGADNPEVAESSDEGSSSEDSGFDWGDPAEEADAAVTALEEAALTPLFEGSNHSSMGTTYILLSGAKLHGCTDIYIDELFRIFSTSILPQPNSLPKTYREASEYLRRLGHSYISYDVCPNLCCLFRGELELARVCPKCRAPRKKRAGRSEVPHKVARVFPVTPRLKCMFRSPMQAAAMTWHASIQFDDDLMTHVSHSAQWKWINECFGKEFGNEDRNVRMALVTDGFNPNSDKRGTYSIWPILLMNYNIAPWLTTKNYFIMLGVLIPGPKSVTADHFDVFIEPLIEELLDLWTYGVYCIDIARYKESSHFVLKAMVIWTIGDFPAYGMLAGCTTNGFIGCPVCGEEFRSRRSKVLHKNIFCKCARRFLVEEDHHLRRDEVNFDEMEQRVAPTPVTGQLALANAMERERWLRLGGGSRRDDPVRRHGMKQVSALFRLPYWLVSFHRLLLSCASRLLSAVDGI